MKSAFLTGGTGFLGQNLLEQMAASGQWRVIALHRPTSDTEKLKRFGAECVAGDIHDANRLHEVMPREVDAVFHLASNTSMWKKNNSQQWRDNVEGADNMIAAALHSRARRFIYTSTWVTYGIDHVEISEDTPQLGENSWVNYVRTKSIAERKVLEAIDRGLPALIIHPSHIMGRYDTHNWSRMMQMIAQEKLPGVPPGTGSFCHAEQVARAHLAALERGQIGHHYLLGGTDATFLEVVSIMGEILGKKVPTKPMPTTLMKIVACLKEWGSFLTGKDPGFTPEVVAMTIHHPKIVSTKAEDELGYKRVPLRAMIEDSYRWLVSEGLLG